MSSGCLSCEEGTYSLGGRDVCTICKEGKISGAGASGCVGCEPGYVVEGNVCEPCPKGRYAAFGDSVCSDCGNGKYSAAGAAYCSTVGAGKRIVKSNGLRVGVSDCEANTFSTGANDTCARCEGGHSEAGSSSCTETAPGYYYDGMTDRPCVAGKFSASGASSESGCEECVNGKYSADGAAYCSTAEAGKSVVKDGELRVGLTDCLANTFSTGAEDDCTACEVGHSEAGSSSCVETAPGHYYDGTTDKECPPGTFSELGGVGVESCSNCNLGFASEGGKGFCDPCLAGYRSSADGDECVPCPRGTFSSQTSSECISCEVSKFTSKEEVNEVCSRCDDVIPGSITLGEGSHGLEACVCNVGEFMKTTGDGSFACVAIEEAGVCSLSGADECLNENVTGTTVESIDVLPGFWRVSNRSLIVRKCSDSDFCVGGQDYHTSCRENHVGPYCKVCADDHMMTLDGCELCEEEGRSTTIAALVVMFILIILTLYYVLFKKDVAASEGSMKKIAELWRWLAKFGKKKVIEYRVQLKVILAYSQIATAMSFNFDITFPLYYNWICTWIYGVFNLDFFFLWNISVSFVPIGCIFDLHYWRRTVSSAYLLIGVMGGLLAYYNYLRKSGSSQLSFATLLGRRLSTKKVEPDKSISTSYTQERLSKMSLTELKAIEATLLVDSLPDKSMRSSVKFYISNQGLGGAKRAHETKSKSNVWIEALQRQLGNVPLVKKLLRTEEGKLEEKILQMQKTKRCKVGARVKIMVGKQKGMVGEIVYSGKSSLEEDVNEGFPYEVKLDGEEGEEGKSVFFYSTSSFYVLVKDGNETSSDDAQRAISVFGNYLFLSFLIFPTTITKLFYMMACEEFHDEDNDDYCVDLDGDYVMECGIPKATYDTIKDGAEGYFLKQDYSLKCYDSNYYWYQFFAVIGIIVYACIPLSYFSMLYRERAHINPGQAGMVATQVVRIMDETLHVNRESEAAIARALHSGGKLRVLTVKGALKESLRLRKMNEGLHPKMKRLHFLYDTYEPQFWYFELVECARRVMFTAVLGFISTGSMSQIIVSMLLSIFFVRIYNATSPYVETKHDQLAEIAQWQIFLTMFCALVIRSGVKEEAAGVDGGGDEAWVDSAVVVLQLVLPCLLMYQQFLVGKARDLENLEVEEEDSWVEVFLKRRLGGALSAYSKAYRAARKGGVGVEEARGKACDAAVQVLVMVKGVEVGEGVDSREKLKLVVVGLCKEYVREQFGEGAVKGMEMVGGKLGVSPAALFEILFGAAEAEREMGAAVDDVEENNYDEDEEGLMEEEEEEKEEEEEEEEVEEEDEEEDEEDGDEIDDEDEETNLLSNIASEASFKSFLETQVGLLKVKIESELEEKGAAVKERVTEIMETCEGVFVERFDAELEGDPRNVEKATAAGLEGVKGELMGMKKGVSKAAASQLVKDEAAAMKEGVKEAMSEEIRMVKEEVIEILKALLVEVIEEEVIAPIAEKMTSAFPFLPIAKLKSFVSKSAAKMVDEFVALGVAGLEKLVEESLQRWKRPARSDSKQVDELRIEAMPD